jgi:hypothetical protein
MMRSYHLDSVWPRLLGGAEAYWGEDGKALGANDAEGSVKSGGRELSRGLP